MPIHAVIDTLQKIASKAVDAAAEQFNASNKALSDETSKLTMLQIYRDEYHTKLLLKLTNGLDMQAHQNYQRFLNMLDNAIQDQATVVENIKVLVLKNEKKWQDSYTKKFSYDVLGDRANKKAQSIEGRKDQKLMDEFAMRVPKIRLV